MRGRGVLRVIGSRHIGLWTQVELVPIQVGIAAAFVV